LILLLLLQLILLLLILLLLIQLLLSNLSNQEKVLRMRRTFFMPQNDQEQKNRIFF